LKAKLSPLLKIKKGAYQRLLHLSAGNEGEVSNYIQLFPEVEIAAQFHFRPALKRKSLSENHRKGFFCFSAEKAGFEPAVRLPVRMFSKHVLSASQAPLQNRKANVLIF